MKRKEVFQAIGRERARQELKHGKAYTCASDGLSDAQKCAVLTEEIGEVAKWICDNMKTVQDPEELKIELIQVAAVAVAWVESLH